MRTHHGSSSAHPASDPTNATNSGHLRFSIAGILAKNVAAVAIWAAGWAGSRHPGQGLAYTLAVSQDFIVYARQADLPALAELRALGAFEVRVGTTTEMRQLYRAELAASGEEDRGLLAVLDACDAEVVLTARGEAEVDAARSAALALAARCDGWFSDPQVGDASLRRGRSP